MKIPYIGLLCIVLISCNRKQHKEPFVGGQESIQLPYFNTQDFTPDWHAQKHKIQDFSLINQNGDTITNTSYKGKIYVANFFFTICPGICPKLTQSMGGLQEKYTHDDDIQLLSHSVMPWHDSVEVLARYARRNKVDSHKWNLVTGTKKAIYDLARNGYFADGDFGKTKGENNFIHTENFILVDKEGYIRGVYNGTLGVEMQRLSRHITLLKKEYEHKT